MRLRAKLQHNLLAVTWNSMHKIWQYDARFIFDVVIIYIFDHVVDIGPRSISLKGRWLCVVLQNLIKLSRMNLRCFTLCPAIVHHYQVTSKSTWRVGTVGSFTGKRSYSGGHSHHRNNMMTYFDSASRRPYRTFERSLELIVGRHWQAIVCLTLSAISSARPDRSFPLHCTIDTRTCASVALLACYVTIEIWLSLTGTSITVAYLLARPRPCQCIQLDKQVIVTPVKA